VKLLIILAYLIIVGWLGWLGYKQTHSQKDYYLGGRKIHPFVMALSYGATFISTSAIIGFGGLAGTYGMSLMWLTFLCIFLGIIVAFLGFGKQTRRLSEKLESRTFAELIGKRFESPFLRRFIGLVIIIFMPVYTAAVMIGAAKFLQSSFAIGYHLSLIIFSVVVAVYVLFGGLKAVMYSDAFQGALMFLGMLLMIVWLYVRLGGFTPGNQALDSLMAQPDVQEQAASLIKGGFAGWARMPVSGTPIWYTVVTTVIMGVGIGCLSQPQLAVRFMSVKSDREIEKAVPIGGLFILAMLGGAFTIGAISNVFFYQDHGMIATLYAGATDNIMPVFITEYMPEWFSSVFMIVIIAAGMSTLSSQFHTIGASAGVDIAKNVNAPQTRLLRAKLGMLFGITLSIVLSIVLPTIWDAAIGISTSVFFSLCSAAFLPLYVITVHVKRAGKRTAILGMLSGFSVALLWMLFVNLKQASAVGLCNLLFGKPALFGGMIGYLDAIVPGLITSAVVTTVSYFICDHKKTAA
ncbi:MAG: sodium:solute symporter family protein, partial [Bacillota bacterium]